MNIYLFEISDPQLINEKVAALGHNLCDDMGAAQAIVYAHDIQDLLVSETDYQKAQYIVSAKEFTKKEDPFSPYKVNREANFTATFESESITDVTRILEEGVESVFDGNSFSDLNRYLKLISLELVQNALIYGRSQSEQMSVDYEIVRGEESYSITVRDQYGVLDRERFFTSMCRAYKERTYETKSSGAGLGLSMILSASDELSITRKQGEFTQIRSIISKYKRLKEYKNKKTNLSFMEEF